MNLPARPPVLMLGLGESGLAMARWCARCGAQVTVWDSREQPPQAAALARGAEAPHWQRRAGAGAGAGRRADGAQEPRPGAARRAHRAAARRSARRRPGGGGELDLFARALADLKAGARLRAPGAGHHRHQRQDHDHRADRAAGRALRPARGGGRQHRPDLLDTLAAALDARPSRRARAAARGLGAGAVELPARRRAGLRAHAATVLNVTQDHLDWHGDMAAYAAAKARIFGSRADGAQPRRPAGRGHGAGADLAKGPGAASPCCRPWCASGWTRRSARATSASWSRTAWPGWCAR
jgi:UDP-N-acetylmuramoylalanine--D-glutamate ligase